mgnify:CR=1 FL=1
MSGNDEYEEIEDEREDQKAEILRKIDAGELSEEELNDLADFDDDDKDDE